MRLFNHISLRCLKIAYTYCHSRIWAQAGYYQQPVTLSKTTDIALLLVRKTNIIALFVFTIKFIQ